MKKPILLLLAAAMVQTCFLPSLYAQYRGARDYMKRLNPPSPQPQRPAPALVRPNTVVRPAATNDPAKAKIEEEEKEKRIFEFQKEQAEAGSPRYQYEVGMRYFTGKGVEKDVTAAKQWLEKSAKKGNEDALKQLEILKKLEKTEAEVPFSGPSDFARNLLISIALAWTE